MGVLSGQIFTDSAGLPLDLSLRLPIGALEYVLEQEQ